MIGQSKKFGFVTVRVASSRLPGKCLLPLGTGSVLDHVIRRAIHFEVTPIICTSTDMSDDVLEPIASRFDIAIYRGSVKNKLKRWKMCADKFGIEFFHTIDADDPYLDYDLVKQSLKLLEVSESDFIPPTRYSASGAASVGYSFNSRSFEKISEIEEDSQDTEMIEPWLKQANLRGSFLPEDTEQITNLRLTLDYSEDYELINNVYRKAGSLATRSEVNRILREEPELKNINWHLNELWAKRQELQKLKKGRE